jgi:perosamine synthetase
VQAVVGLEQLKKLPGRVARMRAMWERYHAGLSPVAGLRMLPPRANDAEWIPWFHDVYVVGGAAVRAELIAFMRAHRVQLRKMYGALSSMAALAGTDERYPAPRVEAGGPAPRQSQLAADSGLFLPSSTTYDDATVDLVVDLIRLFFDGQGGEACAASEQ